MANRLIVHVLFVFLLSNVVIANGIKQNSVQASSDAVNITIYWATDNDANVSEFEISRSSNLNGPFVLCSGEIKKIEPAKFMFIDKDAFLKATTVYYYRIKFVGATDYTQISVSHNTSGVRRTWGSIKAMFR